MNNLNGFGSASESYKDYNQHPEEEDWKGKELPHEVSIPTLEGGDSSSLYNDHEEIKHLENLDSDISSTGKKRKRSFQNDDHRGVKYLKKSNGSPQKVNCFSTEKLLITSENCSEKIGSPKQIMLCCKNFH